MTDGFILAAKPPVKPEDPWYWRKTGLTPEIEDADVFATRIDAFVTWNDHANNFPGWTAEIIFVQDLPLFHRPEASE